MAAGRVTWALRGQMSIFFLHKVVTVTDQQLYWQENSQEESSCNITVDSSIILILLKQERNRFYSDATGRFKSSDWCILLKTVSQPWSKKWNWASHSPPDNYSRASYMHASEKKAKEVTMEPFHHQKMGQQLLGVCQFDVVENLLKWWKETSSAKLQVCCIHFFIRTSLF